MTRRNQNTTTVSLPNGVLAHDEIHGLGLSKGGGIRSISTALDGACSILQAYLHGACTSLTGATPRPLIPRPFHCGIVFILFLNGRACDD